MASIVPNTFMVPNLYVDKAQHYLTLPEQAVLLRMTREILGWQHNVEERTASVALKVFTEGKTKVFGDEEVKVMLSCGLTTRAAVREALNGLVRYHFIEETGKISPRGKEYRLQFDETLIDWDGLEQRLAERREGYRSATRHARKMIKGQNARRKAEHSPKQLKPDYTEEFEDREVLYANLRRACGVGDVLANTLLDHLGPDTHNVLVAGKAHLLRAVPGVGKVAAEKLIHSYALVADRLGKVDEPKEEERVETAVQHAKLIYLAYEKKRRELNGQGGLTEWNMGHLVKAVKRSLNNYTADDVVNCALYLTTTKYYRGNQLVPIHPGSVAYHIEQWIALDRPPTEPEYRKRQEHQRNAMAVSQIIDEAARGTMVDSDAEFLRQRELLKRMREPSAD